jgi:hypothetical protein
LFVYGKGEIHSIFPGTVGFRPVYTVYVRAASV